MIGCLCKVGRKYRSRVQTCSESQALKSHKSPLFSLLSAGGRLAQRQGEFECRTPAEEFAFRNSDSQSLMDGGDLAGPKCDVHAELQTFLHQEVFPRGFRLHLYQACSHNFFSSQCQPNACNGSLSQTSFVIRSGLLLQLRCTFIANKLQ